MNPRRRLLLIWGLLAILLVAVLATEFPSWRGGGAGDAVDEDAARLWMPVPPDELAAVEVLHGDALHRFEVDAQGVWFYHGVHAGAAGAHEHTPDLEASARISKALSGTARAKLEREFPLGTDQGAQYGVATPGTLVLFHRKGQAEPVAQYAVGDMAPDGASQYVLQVGSRTVRTLPGYQIQNLVRLVESFTSPTTQAPAPAVDNPPPLK